MELVTVLETDEYRDLCERVAIAEERLTALYDYIENCDIKEAERYGRRDTILNAETVKIIVGYTEKMAAFGQISKLIKDKEAEKKAEAEKEEKEDGNAV